MATILNIETSGAVCSAAVSKDGVVEYSVDDASGMKHAEVLAPFVEKCLQEISRREWILDAVAVSIGPGSYTGLRIGLSLAKGLCFSKDIPLIGVSTLKILAVKAMFRNFDWVGDELLVPMIDARRMEVYTAAYDFSLLPLRKPGPMVLENESYSDLLVDHKLYFMGDGSGKAREVIHSPNAHWVEGIVPYAKDMIALSEKAFREKDFLDVAYSVPEYLKEYQTTVAKNKVFK